MVSNYLVKFLEEKEVPTITKKRHTYLTYYGLEQQDTYVLKEGIVKTSIICVMEENLIFLILKDPILFHY